MTASRLPSMVGGVASSDSITERMAIAHSHPGIELSKLNQFVTQKHPRLAAALLLGDIGAIGVHPISAACLTIGNWTVPASQS